MIHVRSITLHCVPLKTRMPFRYGIAVMTELPHVFLLLEAEIDGSVHRGIAADHLPPKWFTKDPERDPKEETGDMLSVIHHAAGFAHGLKAESVFRLWKEIHYAQSTWAQDQGFPPLLSHFGTSLVERALIDAVCRKHSCPFHQLLHANLFGIDLGNLHAELKGSGPADWLPPRPLESVICRHTIGLSDPLEASSDCEQDEALPRSLSASIRRYGLRHFKIKVDSPSEESLARLRDITDIIQRETNGHFRASLDGNESFLTVEAFRDYWLQIRSQKTLEPLVSRLLFVEQPFHRNCALEEEVRRGLASWPGHPPMIIDESDSDIGSLPRALQCGYAGTSHKNCKGVLHGVASASLLAKRRHGAHDNLIMSGEDLANIGPVALLQDLAVQAALGNASVERNGHHYFDGLSFWPAAIQRQMLREHSDLYQTLPAGWPSLIIKEGHISLRSINQSPFGPSSIPDLALGTNGGALRNQGIHG